MRSSPRSPAGSRAARTQPVSGALSSRRAVLLALAAASRSTASRGGFYVEPRALRTAALPADTIPGYDAGGARQRRSAGHGARARRQRRHRAHEVRLDRSPRPRCQTRNRVGRAVGAFALRRLVRASAGALQPDRGTAAAGRPRCGAAGRRGAGMGLGADRSPPPVRYALAGMPARLPPADGRRGTGAWLRAAGRLGARVRRRRRPLGGFRGAAQGPRVRRGDIRQRRTGSCSSSSTP